MSDFRIPSVNQVQPGILVVHRYTSEIGIVLRVNWRMVEVLLGSGTVVKWAFGSFRSTYGIPT